MEELTRAICEEYRKKALLLSGDGNQDAGARRSLRIELQNKCGIPEIWAINIINGYNAGNYLAIIDSRKNGTVLKDSEEKREFLEWQARKEEIDRIQALIQEDEKKI